MKIRQKRKTGLEEILNSEKTKEIMEYVLNKAINLKIKDISYLKDIEYSALSEYNFKLNKFQVVTFENKVINMYIRFVDKGKVKESIFCYWNSIYEEDKIVVDNKPNICKKIFIREVNIEKYKKEISLEIQDGELEALKNRSRLCFIELKKYLNEKNEEFKYEENFKQYLDSSLFIGMINN